MSDIDSRIRQAKPDDIAFLVESDLSVDDSPLSDQEQLLQHRSQIASFVYNEDKVAFVLEIRSTESLIGMIMARFIDRWKDSPNDPVFRELDPSMFSGEATFCEIFQLWVDPDFRRRAFATRLKKRLEKECLHRGIDIIHTLTQQSDQHVINLNLKLGYREVGRGKMPEHITRVSLIKNLRDR